MFKVVVCNDEAKMPDDDIFYVVGKNGQFIRKNMGLIDALVPVKNISILNNVKPYVRMRIPKMPSKTFTKVVSFFKKVYDLYKSEAVVMLYLEKDNKKYYIHVPPQTVSGASVNYEREISFPGKTLVGTIHSHSNFGAFHSGTDTDDEKGFDGVHITVGHLGDEYYHSVVCSLVANGFRAKVEPEDYIHITKNTTDRYIIVESYFPLEWLSQVTHEPPTFSKYHWRSQRRRNRAAARGIGAYTGFPDFLDPNEDEGGDEDPFGLPFGYNDVRFSQENLRALQGIYASPRDFVSNFDTEDPRDVIRRNAGNSEIIIIRNKTDIENFFDKDENPENVLRDIELMNHYEGELCDTYDQLTYYQKQNICNTCALTRDCCSTCMYNDRFRKMVKEYREERKRKEGG